MFERLIYAGHKRKEPAAGKDQEAGIEGAGMAKWKESHHKKIGPSARNKMHESKDRKSCSC
eukprot:5697635-Amphidinium_carterae.1